ncbi:hypothetical protein B2J93_2386 [Marssonina coronariae]|uniref:Uncharacterized protein n=1 Tax=Diplocarpon coronariae TaxID=2795749 RepID=A0A218Z294_9HELO|nr:hypothetical protein B2J93_2386 [Marssonina coronariae]
MEVDFAEFHFSGRRPLPHGDRAVHIQTDPTPQTQERAPPQKHHHHHHHHPLVGPTTSPPPTRALAESREATVGPAKSNHLRPPPRPDPSVPPGRGAPPAPVYPP